MRKNYINKVSDWFLDDLIGRIIDWLYKDLINNCVKEYMLPNLDWQNITDYNIYNDSFYPPVDEYYVNIKNNPCLEIKGAAFEKVKVKGVVFEKIPGSEVAIALGAGPKPLSIEALEARKPFPPDVLANALQDKVHVDINRVRLGCSIKR